MQKLKSNFTRTINWNRYQQNQYLGYLINPSFQGVSKLFVLSFENENDRTTHTGHYLPKSQNKSLWRLMVETFLIS